MGGFYGDGEYFAFLDALHPKGTLSLAALARARDGGQANTVLAASLLVREFPGLRPEEARAVCADWRATYHERRTRPAHGAGR